MKKFLLLLTVLVSVFAFGTACGGGSDSSSSPIDSSQTVESGLKTMNVSLASKSFDYDGNEHSLVLDGELPEKAVVAWQNNSLKDVGEKTVFATVRCQGYKDVSLKATLTVVGQDMPDELALENATISVDYGAAYAFAVNNDSLLPEGYSLTETYVDMSSGEVLKEKPDLGGDFRYVLQINAPGYNTKVIHGELTIARPSIESVKIINLPTLAIPKYHDKSAILPGMTWVPDVEGLPKGHQDVEFVFSSSNEERVKFVDGVLVALDNPGECKITVSVKDTSISQTYTIAVSDAPFIYEDFENSEVTLYQQQYVMYTNEAGQWAVYAKSDGIPFLIPQGKQVVVDEKGEPIFDDDGNPQFTDIAPVPEYYDAYANYGTASEIVTNNGNSYLNVTGGESYSAYYSFFEIDAVPTGGWSVGTYQMEIDVTGDYAFTFYWNKDGVDSVLNLANQTSGVLSNFEAIIQDGKIIITFRLYESNIGSSNSIKFCQFSRNAFDYTVDNILIYKIK